MATVVEYGLIAAGVAVAVIAAAAAFNKELGQAMNGSVTTTTVTCQGIDDGIEPIVAEWAKTNKHGTAVHLKNGDKLNYSVAYKCVISRTSSPKKELD